MGLPFWRVLIPATSRLAGYVVLYFCAVIDVRREASVDHHWWKKLHVGGEEDDVQTGATPIYY